jgi:hypothetical protein
VKTQDPASGLLTKTWLGLRLPALRLVTSFPERLGLFFPSVRFVMIAFTCFCL